MIEYIIDYLHDDNLALKTCSLVSKELRNPSQYHLFHFIKVVDDTSLTKLRDFANLLVASTLGRFIRHLHLYNGSFGVPLHGVEIDPPLLLSILAPLRQLRTIQFSSMYWRIESLLQTELQLPLVMGLSVTHFPHKYETYGIPALLYLFPNLKELRVLLDCFGEYPDTSRVHGLPLPPNLRLDTLHFMSPLSRPSLIEAITSTDSLHCLRVLSVEVSTIDYLSPLGRFLRHSGSTLKHLTLDISDTDDATDLAHLLETPQKCWGPLEINNCSVLESLSIVIPVDGSSEAEPGLEIAHSWLSYFVQTITSPHFKTLTIDLRGTDDIGLFIDMGNWEIFQQWLNPNSFPYFQNLIFFESTEDWPQPQKKDLDEGAVIKLKNLLPELSRKQILKFNYLEFREREKRSLLSSRPEDAPWIGATYRS